MKTSTFNNIKGQLLIIIGSLFFASYGVWSRLMGNYFDSFYQGWTRGLVISLILLPILIYKKQIVKINKKDYKWLAIFLVFTSLTQAPLYYAFNHMDIGTATVLFYVSMLLTMYVIGFVFLGEKLTKIKIIAFLLASTGLYITFSSAILGFVLFAGLMAMLNGIASGGEVSSSKKLTGNYSSLYVVFLSWSVVFVTNLPVSLALGEIQQPLALNMQWVFQICYIVSSLVAFGLVIEGLKTVESSLGGLLGTLEVVFSVMFGIIIFNQVPTSQVIVGSVLVLSAAILPNLYNLVTKKV